REPMRLEFWGDELVELRQFDIATQRTTTPADRVVILPVEVQGDAAEERFERASLVDLLPPGSLVVLPRGTALKPELERVWSEAEHHIDLARRRGEDAAPREELFEPPAAVLRRLDALPTLEIIATADEDPR